MATIKNLEFLDDNELVEGGINEITVDLAGDRKLTLIGKQAGGTNYKYSVAWHNSLSEKVEEANRLNRKKKKKSENQMIEDIQITLEEDHKRFIKHVFTDWRLTGTDGKPVQYDPELCLKVLKKLTNTQWEDVVKFFENENNFTGSALTKEVAENLGKE